MKTNLLNKKDFLRHAEEIVENDFEHINSCMILAPHPDDESLGCGGLISLLVAHNINVSVVVTTDGSMSHPNAKSYSPQQLAEVRKGEILNALGILGVAKEKSYFLNGKDSALASKNEVGFSELVDKLALLLKEELPQLVLVPYELDPHCDHRATWQLLNEALKNFSKVKVWEYPIWLYELAAQGDIPTLKNGELKKLYVQPFLEKKMAAIHSHLSQTTRMIDDPTGFMLTPQIIEHFATDYEYFFERK